MGFDYSICEAPPKKEKNNELGKDNVLTSVSQHAEKNNDTMKN